MNYRYIFSVLFLSFFFITNPGSQKEECLSVPPGGFSGFWYFISKLQKNKIENEKYYCASSGCLAVISNYIDIHKVYNFALISRSYGGSIENMKNSFIHLLIKEINFVPNITVVTLSKYGTCIERTPKNKRQFKTLLIKTTDIPFIISTHGEIDGGPCFYFMNRCKRRINLPLTYKFIINILNYNLTNDDILYFYNYI
tara:strand:- start:3210 stop:3803 length:594 start_codon:yes stop_codon:yes gene_type:complete